ncbi:MAG: hypothetical protein ACF8MF_06280 [Phycisphaerales bacterium JB052]
MSSSSKQTETTMQARRSGLVIAAIGLQLMLCSIASAANAAGDSIDRSARKLPAQMAQAFRDIVDRSVSVHQSMGEDHTPGYRLSECPSAVRPVGVLQQGATQTGNWARRVLNLPPPALI